MRVGLISGHNGYGTGASGIIDEGVETIKLRNLIGTILRGHTPNISLAMDNESSDLKNVLKWLKTLDSFDVLLDIHFNAFNKKAQGTEVIVADDATDEARVFAEGLLEVVCKALGTKSRGVKNESQSQHNRLGILHTGNAKISLLLEVCFCDNADDVEKYLMHRDLLALKVAEYLGAEKNLLPLKESCNLK